MLCSTGSPCAGANASPCIGSTTAGIAVLRITRYAAAPRSGPCRPHRVASSFIGSNTSGILGLCSTSFAAAPRSGPCRPHRMASPLIGSNTSGSAVLCSTSYAAAPRSGPCRSHRGVGLQSLGPTADVRARGHRRGSWGPRFHAYIYILLDCICSSSLPVTG
jgi:hypothetical protein